MGKLHNYNLNVDFEYIELGCCGFSTLLPSHFIEARRADHKSFYCPSCGCNRYYPQKSREELLEERVEAERRGKELAQRQAQDARNSARAQKAAKTRLKNRAKAGICPCCNRHFKQLAAHMKNKHPDFARKEK